MRQLIEFEYQKIIKNKTIIGGIVASLIILAGILFIGYIYSQNYSSQVSNVKEGYQKNIDKTIQDTLTGELTDEKVRSILGTYLETRQAEGKDSFSFYPFYWQFGKTFIKGGIPSIADQLNASHQNGEMLAIDDIPINSVNSLGFRQFSTPLLIGNYVPWTDLFRVLGNVFILSSILVILICSVIFADDTSKNINQLLFTTKLGRNKLNLSKITVGQTLSLVIFTFFQLINFSIFALLFDTSGGSSSIQTNFGMTMVDFPLKWNHWQTFFFIICLQIMAILFTASITLMISALSTSPMATFAISLGAFFLPYLLTELIKEGFVHKLLLLFPLNFANPVKALPLLASESYLLTSFVSNAFLLLLFLSLVTVSLNLLTYVQIKKWRFD